MATLSTEDTVRQAVAKLEALQPPVPRNYSKATTIDVRTPPGQETVHTIDVRTPPGQETVPASPDPSVRQMLFGNGPKPWLPIAANGGHPSDSLGAARPPPVAANFAACEDPLNVTSSESYFKSAKAFGKAAAAGASLLGASIDPVCGGANLPAIAELPSGLVADGQRREPGPRMPFPQARGTALKAKLNEAAPEVAALRDSVMEAMAKPQMHLVEVQQFLKSSEGIQDRTQLTALELRSIGWPADVLRQMRAVLQSLEKWQATEKAAKDKLESGKTTVRDILKALDELCTAWCVLGAATAGSVKVDLNMQRRGWVASALVSAMIDAAVALLKEHPDIPMVRQLELQLKRGASQPQLQDLGIQDLLASTLAELAQCLQGLPSMAAQTHDQPVPEALWHAIVKGDAGTVVAVMQTGGLTSGRICDQHGHSVLWDAVAFNQAELALLLLKYFPPDNSERGVNLGETHDKSGNNLLHLAASHKPFNQSAQLLFTKLFEHMPEALQGQCNFSGQTFLHLAAANMNFWLMRFVLQHGMLDALSKRDEAGWCPRSILANELRAKKIAERPPVQAGKSGGEAPVQMPPWCRLGAFQPPKPGAAPPPFADCAVEVKDSKRGVLRIHAHRVILAGCSAQLRKELDALRPPRGELDTTAPTLGGGRRTREVPNLIHVDPKCCNSIDLAYHAVRYLYLADASWVGECEASDVRQALRFVRRCGLPDELDLELRNALLQRLGEERSHALIPETFKQVEQLGLGGAAQLYLARCLISNDRAWEAMRDQKEDSYTLVLTALTKLELYLTSGKVDDVIALQSAEPTPGSADSSPQCAVGTGAHPYANMFVPQHTLQQQMLPQHWQQQQMQQPMWPQHQGGRGWS